MAQPNLIEQIELMSQDIIQLKEFKTNIFNTIYPVGSIYIGVNSINPATLFGGSWAQIKDTFLLAAGTTYAAGAVGGEAEHTLSENEMPKHRHKFQRQQWYSADTQSTTSTGTIYSWKTSTGGSTSYGYVGSDSTYAPAGSSQPHNNMPPYLAVYVWKRIS